MDNKGMKPITVYMIDAIFIIFSTKQPLSPMNQLIMRHSHFNIGIAKCVA